VVRFRHPEGKAVRAVTVNGGSWRDFDPVKGDVRLGPTVKGRVEIRADY
jgi:hypothetical protein